jgi:hypothetical protein
VSIEVLDVKDAISRLSYKPGWKFDYECHGVQTLVITAVMQHSETLKPVEFTIRRVVPQVAKAGINEFLSWWEDMLIGVEIHEVREFAQYDQRLVDDPHKPVRPGEAT